MHRPAVSVVIPVYKVEAYLSRCVDSVLRQTLQDLQIILVDDGSPDGCPQICDEYAHRDARIQVIHKANGGLASARNAGMAVASGKWLFFLDSDDWLEPDGLESLLAIGEEYEVDFVRYRAIRSGWPGLAEHAPCMVEAVRELRNGYYSRQQILDEVYPRLIITPQLTMGAVVGAWGSLYNLDFLRRNQLSFYEEVKFSEDLVFSARVVRAANSFYFVDTPGVYHYFYNPNSISKSFRAGRWDSCKALIETCERDFSKDPEYDFTGQLHYLRWFCILLALGERKRLNSYKQKHIYCKEILSDPVVKHTPLHLKSFDVSWKQKLYMLVVKCHLTLFVAKF
jgi:glycosyltransferase involved in cell wall biosynthesis